MIGPNRVELHQYLSATDSNNEAKNVKTLVSIREEYYELKRLYSLRTYIISVNFCNFFIVILRNKN